MNKEELKFGTSGVRGRVVDFTAANCAAYAVSFAQLLRNQFANVSTVFMARDLRDSSANIQSYFSQVLENEDFKVISLGEVPTPTLALYAQAHHAASIMVTGSHIPADRNGVKFYTPDGEITKEHEIEIRKNFVLTANPGVQSSYNFLNEKENQTAAEQNYLNRYLNFFGKDFLNGVRVLFYQHSTVGRNLLPKILENLGARVVLAAWSEKFIPVDTENVSNLNELESLMFNSDAEILVSADGDADRPLVIHRKQGQIVGDLLGLMTARYLGIEAISIPVSCTSLIDDSAWFKKIERTKIGSPFVISGMEKIRSEFNSVAGFEANGGFILGADIKSLRALGTRDALLPIIAYLKLHSTGWLQENEEFLFSKSNVSGLLKDFPLESSQALLKIVEENPSSLMESSPILREQFSSVKEVNKIDGIKFLSANGVSVHLRPSGNAPEFRVYVEAGNKALAEEILREALKFCEGCR